MNFPRHLQLLFEYDTLQALVLCYSCDSLDSVTVMVLFNVNVEVRVSVNVRIKL